MSDGVPLDEATAKDHIQVRAKLVRRLGGANQALVWSRIWYRADKEHRAAELVDGQWWWQASYALLAEETGLTEKQARVAVGELIQGGFIHQHPGFGRAYRYRPIVHQMHLPSGADRSEEVSAQGGRSIRPEGQIHLPSGAVTPLIDLEDVKTSLSPDESDDGTLIPEAWRPNQAHVDKAASLHLDARREYQRFREHAERTHRRLKNWNAGFTNWLRKQAEFAQERQGRPAPSTRTFAQQRQQNTLALVEKYRQQEEGTGHAEVTDGGTPRLRALNAGS